MTKKKPNTQGRCCHSGLTGVGNPAWSNCAEFSPHQVFPECVQLMLAHLRCLRNHYLFMQSTPASANNVKKSLPLKPRYIFLECPLVCPVLPPGAAQNKASPSEKSNLASRNEGSGRSLPAGLGSTPGTAPALNV